MKLLMFTAPLMAFGFVVGLHPSRDMAQDHRTPGEAMRMQCVQSAATAATHELDTASTSRPRPGT